MNLDATTKWILIGSIFGVLMIGFTTWFILFLRAKKLRRTSLLGLDSKAGLARLAQRQHQGELLWDLKANLQATTSDHNLEFSINNVIRNHYQTIYIIETKHSELKYLATTFAKITQAKIFIPPQINASQIEFTQEVTPRIKVVKKLTYERKFDYIWMSVSPADICEALDQTWGHLTKGGLLFIAGDKIKSKRAKRVIQHLKLRGLRFEFNNAIDWSIIVAK